MNIAQHWEMILSNMVSLSWEGLYLVITFWQAEQESTSASGKGLDFKDFLWQNFLWQSALLRLLKFQDITDTQDQGNSVRF